MNSGQVFMMHEVLQKHEDPLDLQSLPSLSPPQDGWPAIESALRRDHRRRRTRRTALGTLAVAATVTLTLGLVLRVSAPGIDDPGSNEAAAQMAGAAVPDPREVASADGGNRVKSLMSLSVLLEQRLRILRSNVGDLPTGDAVYQVELEDLVTQVDEELSSQPRSAPLWTQRVSLLMDLEQLYEDRLRREYQQVASL